MTIHLSLGVQIVMADGSLYFLYQSLRVSAIIQPKWVPGTVFLHELLQGGNVLDMSN